MKLAIVGGRNFNDYEKLEDAMQFFHIEDFQEVSVIISGGAKGADSLGERYAENWNIQIKQFLPEWNKYGKAAGFIRNQQIVDACDMVLAFWDGESKGTKDTIDKARKAKKPTFIYYF
ncbi:MAG: DUF2493 domain-containing protein [Candidatus Heimdallarchaeaceae archaeon]